MELKQEEQKLIEKFSELSFKEKKKELLYMLRGLYWISDVINTLWERVFNITEDKEEEVIVNVYTYLLDAIYYAKNKEKEQAVDKLKEIDGELSKLKMEEQQDSVSEKKDLDELIKKVDEFEI